MVDSKEGSNSVAADSQADTSAPSAPSDENNGSFRSIAGDAMAQFSAVVNENKLAARYGIVATVGVLGVYAISQTPLFFRYKTASEIPSFRFQTRQYLTGRLLKCTTLDSGVQGTRRTSRDNFYPVTCYIRHLSPMERLLPKTWWNRLLELHPLASFSNGKPEESADELIRIQIAGIQLANDNSARDVPLPPPNSSAHLIAGYPQAVLDDSPTMSLGKSWIQTLSSQRVLVSFQLVGRIVPQPSQQVQAAPYNSRKKRPIPDSAGISSEPVESEASSDGSDDTVVVAKLMFRPKSMQWTSSDLGEWMVRHGYAVVSENGLHEHSSTERLVDTIDHTSRTLRKDVAYVERLSQAEHDAARESQGVWRDPRYRTSRSDLVDEVTFQQSATIWQKLWRRLTQG